MRCSGSLDVFNISTAAPNLPELASIHRAGPTAPEVCRLFRGIPTPQHPPGVVFHCLKSTQMDQHFTGSISAQRTISRSFRSRRTPIEHTEFPAVFKLHQFNLAVFISAGGVLMVQSYSTSPESIQNFQSYSLVIRNFQESPHILVSIQSGYSTPDVSGCMRSNSSPQTYPQFPEVLQHLLRCWQLPENSRLSFKYSEWSLDSRSIGMYEEWFINYSRIQSLRKCPYLPKR